MTPTKPATAYFYSRPCGRGDRPAAVLPPLRPRFLLTPLREGRRRWRAASASRANFYSRPCGRGDVAALRGVINIAISTHAPAGGATKPTAEQPAVVVTFLLTPLREGRLERPERRNHLLHFYSRPCGRGDPAGAWRTAPPSYFYSRPCGRGDQDDREIPASLRHHFYSRPCGRGDAGRRCRSRRRSHFYSRPCGRGDENGDPVYWITMQFLLTPLREGRRRLYKKAEAAGNFYSRPCGRGDGHSERSTHMERIFLLTPLREGRRGA